MKTASESSGRISGMRGDYAGPGPGRSSDSHCRPGYEVPDDQKAAFSQVDYLDEFTPSKETVTMLEPDMIFSWVSLFDSDTLGAPRNGRIREPMYISIPTLR